MPTAISLPLQTQNFVNLNSPQTILSEKTFNAVTRITNNSASTSTSTGALIVGGGLGLLGNLHLGGSINLFGSNNLVNFGISHQANPTFSGSGRSMGTRLVLRADISTGQVDTAIGTGFSGSNSTLWYSVPQNIATAWFSWFGGTTEVARLTGQGAFNCASYKVNSLNAVPATASSAGFTGEIRFTADYIYLCVAASTWKRAALSTW